MIVVPLPHKPLSSSLLAISYNANETLLIFLAAQVRGEQYFWRMWKRPIVVSPTLYFLFFLITEAQV